jgi:hypothetical protein
MFAPSGYASDDVVIPKTVHIDINREQEMTYRPKRKQLYIIA